MQADMQCGYFPGYYSARDLNLNASCSIWPLNNFDKIVKNGHYSNCSLSPPSVEQHLTYKEMLKQTMLWQEAIFMEQICELHHLYNRQRQLMDEVRRSKLYRHHLQLETLQSNPTIPQSSYGYCQKSCQASALPWLNPSCSQSCTLATEKSISHLSYGKGKATQVSNNLSQAEVYLKEPELLESKCKKVGNKILDLELPADEYIDTDEVVSLAGVKIHQVSEVLSYPLKNVSGDVQKDDGEWPLGISDCNLVYQEDNMTQSPFSRKTTGLADLNEPIELEEESKGRDRKAGDVASHITVHREISCQALYGKTNPGFQVKPEIIQKTQTHGAPEACSKVLNLEKNERQDGAGENSTCKQTLNQLVPLADVGNGESSLVPSWRKYTRDFAGVPMAVKALPCINNSVGVSESTKDGSPGITGANPCHGKNIKSNRKIYHLDVQKRFGNSEFECVFADTYPEKHIKGSKTMNIDLNSTSPGSYSLLSDESIWIRDGEKKLENSTIELSRFREKPVHNEISNKKFKRTTTQVEPACLQATISIPEAELTKFEASGTAGIERLLGILLSEDPYKPNDPCSSHGFPHRNRENSSENDASNGEKDGIVDINLDCNSVTGSEQLPANELVVDNMHVEKILGFGFSVDLNSGINEDESSPPTCSEPTEMYLAKGDESSPVRIKSDGNEGETSVQLLGKGNWDSLQELFMGAAEAIVSISSSQVQICVESTMCKPSEASRFDSLYWFSRIANSVVDDPESEFGVALSCKDTDHHHSDGIDYFEAMTLQLKETHMEEYCCITNVQKEEATYPTTFLGQPRKGRTSRGRQQRKDFQSEILPSLASLSRYEVTEDLYAIGGLVEPAHAGWSTGSRKGSRNGCTRRRKPSVSSSNVESAVSPPLKPQNRNSKPCNEKSPIEWGKITRRRRGQRCPASNPRLILAHV